MQRNCASKMNLYFISGLAADERMFERLQFPAHITPVFLPWLKPLKEESLHSYVHRMAESIDSTKPFVLMGLSFGGIVCCELNTFLKPQKTILLSSVCSHKHFPPWFGWVRKYHLENKLSAKTIKATPTGINNYLFGASSPAGKALLADTIKRCDDELLLWSIKQIINWNFSEPVSNLVLIHGSSDKIFPLRYLHPQHIIKNGEHLAVFENAGAASSILSQILYQHHYV